MRNRFLSLSVILIVAFTSGCGGGGHKDSVSIVTSEPGYTWGKDSAIFQDVSLTNGSGQVTLALNGSVGTLIAIPYNTATSAGTYSSTITITGDLKNLSVIPVTSKVSPFSKSSATPDWKFKEKIRERERELLGVLHSKITSSGLKRVSSIKRTYDFQPGEDTVNFIKYYDDINKTTVTATKKCENEYCIIYLDNKLSQTENPHLAQNYLDQLADAFYTYYSDESSFFGNPSDLFDTYIKTLYPNFTKNDKIYILISELYHGDDGWEAGYFDGTNEFPPSNNSNGKKMLYITSYRPDKKSITEWLSIIKGTMAHEFQHLIFFNNRFTKYDTIAEYNSDIWINEGLSMLAEDLIVAGSNKHNTELDESVERYLKNSVNNSLCSWDNSAYDYDPAYMFMRYYVDRYGEFFIKKKLIPSNSVGKAMLTDVAGDSTFTGLFRDWLAAVVLDRIGYSGAGSKFLYRTLDLSSYTGVTLGTLSSNVAIPDTTGGYIIKTGLSGTQSLTVSINSKGNSTFGLRLILLPKEFSISY